MRDTRSPHSSPATDARRDGSQLLAAIARQASERPDAEAVGEVGGKSVCCTYRELAELTSMRATFLAKRVRAGGVVIAVLPAGVEYVSWFCGAIAAGVRLLPMHAQVAGPEALATAQRAGAVAAIVDREVTAANALSALAIHPDQEERVEERESLEMRSGSGAVVLGSSGTTGLPKLALRPSASLDADAVNVIGGLRLTPADRVVFGTPLTHSYGVDILVGTLTAGATLRVMARFDAEALNRELEGGGTVLPGVPFVFEALARRARPARCVLRLAISAGSPLSAHVRREFGRSWGIEIGQLFGATELGTVSVEVPGSPGYDPTSIGKPLPGVSMRVVDIGDSGRALDAGQEGQLAVRTPSMLTEYLEGGPELVDGHLLTGDLARIDAEGRVWITGRLKLMIDVGAFKVNPLEVENVLGTHPDVAECVVVAIANGESVQRLRAVVVPRRLDVPPTVAALRQFVRDRISAIKVPRVIELAASLPRSATGKLLRDRV